MNPGAPWRWRDWSALAVIVVLGAALRFDDLSSWALAGDEALVLLETDALDRPDRFLTNRDTLATGAWLHRSIRALQEWFPGDDLTALRLVPCLAGVLAPLALALCVQPLFGPLAAVLTALLVALSPYHLFASTFGRYPSLVFLCGGVGMLAVFNAAALAKRRWWGIAVAAFVLGGSVHLTAVVAAGVAAMLWLGTSRRRFQAIALGAVAIGLFAALIATQVRIPVFQRVLESVWSAQASARGISGAASFAASLVHDLGPAVPLLAWFAFGQRDRTAGSSPSILAATVAVWLLGFAVAATTIEVGLRYTAAVLPGVFAVAGVGMAALLRTAAARPWAQASIVAVAVAASLPGLLSQRVDNSRYDVRPLLGVLEERYRPGEPVWSESHAVLEYYTGIPCRELPSNLAELRRQLPLGGTAYVTCYFQRGQLVGASGEVQEFVERELQLLARNVPQRLDLQRFETRLYRWRPQRLSD